MRNKIAELAGLMALAEGLATPRPVRRRAVINKLPLTKKQKQKRKVAKLQRAARKKNRK